jgi:chemotaxis protein histidine kinase CheA
MSATRTPRQKLNPVPTTDFELWRNQNPYAPAEDFVRMQHSFDSGGKTGEELTLHDLMTGENGQPRVNPDTGKPYSYLEAYGAVNQSKQDTKPVKENKPDTPEQQFIDEFERTHPNATVAEAVRAYAAATEKPEKPGAGNARSDKSYQYNQGRLDKIRQPVDQLVQRMGRLQDTLNQRNPQADALVGPELMTVMAGGMGSGLRLNEAEISRVVGGRSAWENLKASMQHWATNPQDARTITPEQDKMIRALVAEVGTKLQKKQSLLEETQEKLLNSDDPKEHRTIMAEAQRALDTIDGGAADLGGGGGAGEHANQPQRPSNVPEGYVYQNGPRGKGWYKPQGK